MTQNLSKLDELRERIFTGELNRRDVLKRSLALGLSAPVIAGLLAACGGDDDDDDDDTEAEPTNTTEESGGGGAEEEPTATEAAAEPGGNSAATQTAEAGAMEPTATEGSEEEATATEETAEPMTRGGGGKVTLLYWQAPTILNMHLGQGTKDFHAGQVVLEPLAYLDQNTEPQLVLAAEWPSVDAGTLDPDGNFVVWNLKQNVVWHDGEPFTAEDVAFTFEYVSDPDTTATTLGSYTSVESVEVIDDYTVQINFSEPNPAWFDVFVGGNGPIIPKHILEDKVGAAARDAEFNLSPIGTGPFKVTDFRPGDTVLYEINMDYHMEGLPFFDTVEIKGGGDATSAARAVMVTGEADWAWNLQVEPEILEQMEQEGGEGILLSTPGTSAERIMINFADPNTEVDGAFSEPSTEHPIWKHKEAREALNLAIQRDLIATQLYGAAGVATGDNMNVPSKFKLNWPWEYNLEAAQEKLDAINFPADFDNVNILYQTSVNSVRQKNQEIVKADLETLGFSVELKSVDSGVFFSSDAGNPDTYGHHYSDIEMYTNGPTSPYPISWAERYRSDDIASKANNWAGTNITRWNNPDYDALHDQAKTAIDEQEQIDIWTEMLTLVNEAIVEVPIVWRGGAAAVHNRINWGEASPWAPTPIDQLKFWTLA
ncbi:MAG: peptide ABC transporter substrate-binding protein [Thermomicrobiales bacterium]